MTKIKNNINGWLIIDKPYQMGSTAVVGRLKYLFKPERIGHAGTLDPLATGVLPIAFGQATKTIPFVMDGKKTYIFDVTWGYETATDDAEGEILFRSEKRPSQTEIEQVLPRFCGVVMQVPPAYSALKVNGKRSYDLARAGSAVELMPRPVHIDSLRILSHTPETTRFEVVCGKGTYVRSIGHDLGRQLGCFGYISYLRRTKCGPFDVNHSILLENLEKEEYTALTSRLVSVLTALDDILVLAVSEAVERELVYGRSVPAPSVSELGPDRFNRMTACDAVIGLKRKDQLIALTKYVDGELRPFRVFVNNSN